MTRVAALLCLSLIAVPLALADFPQIVAEADRLHEQDAYEQSRAYLEDSLGQTADRREQAELYWRLARAWLNLGDLAESKKAKKEAVLAFFAKGEELAQKAIELDAGNHLTYYWKCANIGRWGEVKGIMNALAKAKPMLELLQKALQIKSDHSDSYYVLGQLFEQVPAAPLSFGDKDWAVSLGRKSVDLRAEQVKVGREEKLEYDFYTELAKHLWKRNWSAARRLKEQAGKAALFAGKEDPMEKNCYYEAAVKLMDLSDRQEARELVDFAVRELRDLSRRTRGQEDDFQEALELQADWKK